MWEIVRSGGPLMWPIILCSVAALAIVGERLWTLHPQRVMPRGLLQKVWQLVENNQINDKVIAALQQNSPLGRVLAAGLANRHRSREVLMERLEDTGRHVVHELERFLNTLGTIASITPLLGLLGTVTGIMGSFTSIGSSELAVEKVTGGIGEALIATAAGLGIAIGTLVPMNYFHSRLAGLKFDLEAAANNVLILAAQHGFDKVGAKA